tara:strand:- start:1960 stop:2223 length:264 start_codon:yes stop_codon:yes gene_type:complete
MAGYRAGWTDWHDKRKSPRGTTANAPQPPSGHSSALAAIKLAAKLTAPLASKGPTAPSANNAAMAALSPATNRRRHNLGVMSSIVIS